MCHAFHERRIILRRVNARADCGHNPDFDGVPGFERPQLLQLLQFLQLGFGQRFVRQQKLAAIRVQAQMVQAVDALAVNGPDLWRGRVRLIPDEGNRRAAEVQRVAIAAQHDLDDVGLLPFRLVEDGHGQRRHGRLGSRMLSGSLFPGQQLGHKNDAARVNLGFVGLKVDDDVFARPRAASAMRSVPLVWSGSVMTASTPARCAAACSFSSSAATRMRVIRPCEAACASLARAMVCSRMVLPPASRRSLSGKRVDFSRAGRITATLISEI